MFGVELDIRTLAFIATLAAIVQAITLTSLWMVSRQGAGTVFWAAGGVCAAIGFVLLGFRGAIPDVMSIIIANTFIGASHALYWLGIEFYTKRKPNILAAVAIISTVALLFTYYCEVAPDIAARVIVISVALAIMSFGSFRALWFQRKGQRSAPESVVAVTFAAHGIFHCFRAIYTWLVEQEIANFMNASTVHMFAFLDIILFLLLTAVGFTAMIIIALNTSLRAEAKAKDRLFTVLAHDLRTPFQGLAGLSLLAQQDLVAGNQAQALGNIRQLHSSTSETLRFLDDLLIWGRTLFDAGKAEKTEIDIDDLIETTIKVSRPLLETKSINVAYSPQKLVGFGIAPHAQMICRNLLVNAIKYSNPRSTISVSSSAIGNKIHIRVVDRGAGVSDQMIADFANNNAPFNSAEGTSGELGSGVGLTLCRDLCWEDDEHIWLEHNPDGGVIAVFTIAAKRVENPVTQQKMPADISDEHLLIKN